MCGSGRYDGLVSQLGGPHTPAIGWALGMERLLLVLEAASQADPQGVAARLTAMASPEIYVVNRGVAAECVALALTRELRAAGLRVELDSSDGLRQAVQAPSQRGNWALVLGDAEVDRGEVRFKPLQQQAENSPRIEPVDAIVEKLLSL